MLMKPKDSLNKDIYEIAVTATEKRFWLNDEVAVIPTTEDEE